MGKTEVNNYTFLIKIFTVVSLIYTTGCTAFVVHPPHSKKSGLMTANVNSKANILILTEDHIDRDHPIGQIGNTFWGGQYEVTLADSLHDYFETEIVQTLQEKGYTCLRYPGEFIVKRLKAEKKPVILKLVLQDLTLSRHHKRIFAADHVTGVCKIRGVLLTAEGEMIHHRQFVGKVDTLRLADELTLPFIGGWISRAGLSHTLKTLLQDTVEEFKTQAVPEFRIVYQEFMENKANEKKKAPEKKEAKQEFDLDF